MKKMFLAVLSFMFLCVPIQGFAAEDNISDILDIEVNGDLSLEDGAILYTPTEEELLLEKQKLEEFGNLFMQRASFYKKLNVPTCRQETNYYCGPATVQQTIKFINGTAASQATYANELGTTTKGTDMSLIPGVLNAHISGFTYVKSSIGDYSKWCNMIMSSMNRGYPTVIDISTTNVGAWPYSTSGHFLNVSGYDSISTVKVCVTDPYEKGLGSHWYSGPDVYKANNDHWQKAMIW